MNPRTTRTRTKTNRVKGMATATRQPKAQKPAKPARSNISPRLACLNLPSDRAGSVSERPSRRETAATAAAYRAVAARSDGGADADARLESCARSAEREAILGEIVELLQDVPTSILIAWLPVIARHTAQFTQSKVAERMGIRVLVSGVWGDSA